MEAMISLVAIAVVAVNLSENLHTKKVSFEENLVEWWWTNNKREKNQKSYFYRTYKSKLTRRKKNKTWHILQ